jgi:hypothetical protein
MDMGMVAAAGNMGAAVVGAADVEVDHFAFVGVDSDSAAAGVAALTKKYLESLVTLDDVRSMKQDVLA